MSLGVKVVLIDTHDDGRIHIALSRCTQNHTVGAGIQVSLHRRFITKDPSALKNQVNPIVSPGDFRRFSHGTRGYLASIHEDCAINRLNLSAKFAVDGIELK